MSGLKLRLGKSVSEAYNRLPVSEAAALLSSTCSVIPLCAVKGKHFKRPLCEWASCREERPSITTVEGWFRRECLIGLVCGPISGGLEVLDFEGEVEYPKWREVVISKLGIEFFKKLPVCQTPSGGRHVYFRSQQCGRNQVLARTPDPKRGKNGLLIETRGDGGYVATAPSKGYRLLQGNLLDIPVLKLTEREIGVDCAKSFNEVEKQETMRVVGSKSDDDGPRPGDVFNREADWMDILEPAGFTVSGQSRGQIFWCRPGKDGGISAVTGYGSNGDLLCVFSTAVDHLETGRLYDKFGAFATLFHKGEFFEAARDVAFRGYRADQFQPDRNWDSSKRRD